MSEQQATSTNQGRLDMSKPTPERQEGLRALYEFNVAASKPPYQAVRIRTRGEVEWILRERSWTGERHLEYGKTRANLSGAFLRETTLGGVHLSGANLSATSLDKADLSGADLYMANLSDAYLYEVILIDAVLDGADLSRVDLTSADLSGASLLGANLSGAQLFEANLRGTDLRVARMDVATTLIVAKLDRKTHLGDIVWNGVPLQQISAWPERLGDEQAITKAKNRTQRIAAYRVVGRAYRGLSLVLRSQGLLIPASNYRLREQVLERRASFWSGNLLGWAFSWPLNLVAGYGERPVRSFIAYLLVIFGFAAAFFAIGSGVLGIGGHEAINSPVSALVFSVTSFHGRGFFPGGGLAQDDPITTLAACEAIMGLFIEITFIATFTQRFFAR